MAVSYTHLDVYKRQGYEDVHIIDTAQEAFGSRRRAGMMMLGDSRMLVGRK